ncbi:MAG: DNA polymerase IV [Acidimicrobiia bacterium]|nr:DNA polymerase IV [Acidimicrobiia bacterium]
MDEGTILHADLDAFYVSASLLHRPDLRGKPVAVGGGVVLSASYEARAYGVRSGMSGGRARRMCPGLEFVDGSFSDFLDLSDATFEICRRFTPLVEQISIDEAFCDVSGSTHLFGPPSEIARRIRTEVKAETGLPISAGVARTKFLAKVASQVAKPDGLVVVDPKREIDFLHPLPVRMIWGVGPVTGDKLGAYAVETIGDLARMPVDTLRSRFGKYGGRHLHDLAWNRDSRPVVTKRRAGSVGAQSAFGQRLAESERPVVVAKLADRIGARLRKKGRAGRTITVRVRFDDMTAITRSVTVAVATASTVAIRLHAWRLIQIGLRSRPGERPNLFGISVSNLERREHLQLELGLHSDDDPLRTGNELAQEREDLDDAVDAVRDKFGRSALGAASVLLRECGGVPDEFRDLAVPVGERRQAAPVD